MPKSDARFRGECRLRLTSFPLGHARNEARPSQRDHQEGDDSQSKFGYLLKHDTG